MNTGDLDNFFTELKTVLINYSGKAERSMTR